VLAVVVLRLVHLLPENGNPALIVILVLASFIGGMGAVQTLAAGGSIVADIADEHELATGRRQRRGILKARSAPEHGLERYSTERTDTGHASQDGVE
jgi:Na+/melibiose symporter-like transporter